MTLQELNALHTRLRAEEAASDKLSKAVKQAQTAAAVDTSAHKKERQQLDTMRRQVKEP